MNMQQLQSRTSGLSFMHGPASVTQRSKPQGTTIMMTPLTPKVSLAILGIVILVWGAGTLHADWPQFRGPNSSGHAQGASPPIEFGPGKNELWRVPIGVGHSSPCIVGDSIFLTTSDKEKRSLEVVCIGRADGKIRWRRAVKVGKVEKGHPSFNPASSTPASDGQRVVAYFGSFGLICFDMAGAKQWEIKLPLTKSYSGNATSPIIVGNKVILYRANYTDHFLLAVDKKTGKEIWKKPQSRKFTTEISAAATPIVVGDMLIVHSVRAVLAFKIADGQTVWEANSPTTATSTPVVTDKEVIVAAWNQSGEPALVPVFPPFEKLIAENDKDGDKVISPGELPKLWFFHRSEGTDAPYNGAPLRFSHADRDKNGKIVAKEWNNLLRYLAERRKNNIPHGLMVIKLDSKGTVKPSEVRYLERKGIPEVPSPLVHKGHVYFVKNGGILTCLELKSGIQKYRMRTRGKGTYYASPIIAGDKMFLTSGEGKISVVSLGDDPDVLATNDMKEKTYATPAIVDGVIYVRTHKTLSAYASKK
jgi:outer membrane protein assembly factor BamB